MVQARYRVGALILDAVRFVPQSRPRLFVVATRCGLAIPTALASSSPVGPWHTASVIATLNRLPEISRKAWYWWNVPQPIDRNSVFSDFLETKPSGITWHSKAEIDRLLSMMSPTHQARVRAASESGNTVIGTIYKRTRRDENGHRRQRAEVRFDGVSGCLRTPQGGSSRQTIIIVNGARVRARLLSPREAARLMELPDDYGLPSNYNEAYHLSGDGVVVPVVRHLSAHLLEPIVITNKKNHRFFLC